MNGAIYLKWKLRKGTIKNEHDNKRFVIEKKTLDFSDFAWEHPKITDFELPSTKSGFLAPGNQLE